MLLLDHVALGRGMRAQLERRGVCEASIQHVQAALIQTSLRGVDSHGVNLFPHYCESIDAGRITKVPVFELVEAHGATAVVDADFGFGHHAGSFAMGHAIALAKAQGIGAVAVRNSSHFAAASYYGLQAAAQDCMGFAFTTADSLVKAARSTTAFFGTNPICFTVPMADEEPLCLDMATSLVSWNKVMNHRISGEPLGEGWAFDGTGMPTTDPQSARSLNPAGGYKGFGLGMMVDLLCALLSGGPLGADLQPMYSVLSERRAVSHFFMAIDLTAFGKAADIRARVSAMAHRIRSLEPINAEDPVMVPGDPEKRMMIKRLREGIPMDKGKFAQFLALDHEFSKVVIK